ncbi:MAG TPA: rhodanese-like domain-containing protein [Stellaceae bacterium]|nr:rhodanese-like domain-containing protein [Stellaceae bacterium]
MRRGAEFPTLGEHGGTMNRRSFVFGLTTIAAPRAIAGASARAEGGYDDELHDYGLPPAATLKAGSYAAPTPLRIAGARTIVTNDLKMMIDARQPPVVIDVRSVPRSCRGHLGVACGADALSLPLALWLPGAGLGGDLHDPLQRRLAERLSPYTCGNKAMPIVFFAASKIDWLPVNAALRAIALGYRKVYWYRGGRAAWLAAQYPTTPARLIGTLEPVALPAASFCDESVDYGLVPVSTIRTSVLEAPTPTTILGAKTVTTPELWSMVLSGRPPVLVDVIGGNQSMTLPGAPWMPWAGRGSSLEDDVQARLAAELDRLSCGDKSAPIVLFCQSKTCWLSHNASVRAVAMKYRNIYWYRGGRCAWQEAGLPMGPVSLIERAASRCCGADFRRRRALFPR